MLQFQISNILLYSLIMNFKMLLNVSTNSIISSLKNSYILSFEIVYTFVLNGRKSYIG